MSDETETLRMQLKACRLQLTEAQERVEEFTDENRQLRSYLRDVENAIGCHSIPRSFGDIGPAVWEAMDKINTYLSAYRTLVARKDEALRYITGKIITWVDRPNINEADFTNAEVELITETKNLTHAQVVQELAGKDKQL